MPGRIPVTGGGFRPLPQRGGFCAAVAGILCFDCGAAFAATDVVHAALPFDPLRDAFSVLVGHDVVALALTLGSLGFAVVTSVALQRTRRRLADGQAQARDEAIAYNAEIDRLTAFLRAEPQVLVAWAAAADEPEITGDPTLVTALPDWDRLLDFTSWLAPNDSFEIENAVDALRTSGVGFAMMATTQEGRPIEAEGRVIGGRAILRIKEVGGVKRELADVLARFRKQADESAALRALIEAVPAPVWSRDEAGKVDFVNPAYVRAVEAKNAAEAMERGLELFDHTARGALFRAHETETSYASRLPAIVAGNRHSFEVLAVPARRGSVGIAIDVTETEAMRAELARLVDAHRRTLDQLPTGVVIFGADQRLTFYNAAYRTLWDLEAAFLDQGPTDSAVLDRLRSARKLPEEQDFRRWKSELHEAYRATEPKEHMWHLPDGRTLRVVTTPNPEGGAIYLFDDVTKRLDLERRYDALIRVQGETLDNLAEGVAVFASDGGLRLFNPAFARMWKLMPEALAERPHIEAVIGWCQLLSGDGAIWPALRATITAIEDRQPMAGRLERRDGIVVDCATVPLPDGATLVTFQDVTDSVNVERALRERNEALEEADEIKIDFVHHVSYELRSPLTNIIGFAHFLGDPATGPLTEKQREYLAYITTSTNALLAIINNILDLATIDAGAMTLNLGPVDIRKTMEAAAEGVQDRLVQSGISLDLRAAPDIGSFEADERRVRQTLFNLLANAIGFSPAGETVTLSAQRLKDAVVFSVTDRGPGIPPDVKDKVFDWFETHSLGSRHRGTGLGLSLVRSFVELHGGSVTLDSAVGRGTTVTCIFPLGETAQRPAA
jgi:signal transduction histidine kinase